ncbi:uncharacterized protein LOC135119811 [Zophobas morio]|uniref:uncharacterized protein LOC135119811 n=1 Tax=Zophobas morio TaxID=2755281 RepID=UPI00308362B5
MVATTAEPFLEMFKPPGVKSIKITKLEPGTTGPRVVDVKTLKKTFPNQVIMELRIILDAADFRSELTTVMGFMPAPLEVSEVYFEGTVRADVLLTEEFPYASVLKISMLEKPKVDFSVKPLISMDIMNLPGFSAWLHNIITDTLVTTFVDDVVEVDLGSILNPKDTYVLERTAIGVLVLNVYRASNVRKMDILLGSSTPFVRLAIGSDHVETKSHSRTLNPQFDETLRIMVRDIEGTCEIALMDRSAFQGDRCIYKEVISVPKLCKLTEKPVPFRIQMEKGALELSSLYVEIPPFDFDKENELDEAALNDKNDKKFKLEKTSGHKDPKVHIYEQRQGILRLKVLRAKTLKGSDPSSLLLPYVLFYVNDKKQFQTEPRCGVNPEWNQWCEALITDVQSVKLKFKIKSYHFLKVHENLGEILINIGTLLNTEDFAVRQKWFDTWNGTGSLLISLYYTPMYLGEELISHKAQKKIDKKEAKKLKTPLVDKNSKEPLGTLCIVIHSAKELEASDSDVISDPFVSASIDKHYIFKTTKKKKTTFPQWEETFVFPSHDPTGHSLRLELHDYSRISFVKSGMLGNCELDLALKDLPYTGWKPLTGVNKGELNFSVKYSPPS